ncbi:MAG: Rhodanese- sulfurtransferase [Icmadophila ericetorum]|nr:Rhodanese- sulfurtransferase [Icmadophila ericetorum]
MGDAMDVDSGNAMEAINGSKSSSERLSVTITKPIPYTFDLGNLLLLDANPVPSPPSPTDLHTTARDCAQALINQLLTACPIHIHPTDGTLLTLPPCTTPLPREKPLPEKKGETKWEKFARKKGIVKGRRGENGEGGRGKMVYDEEKGEWVPKWGYKGRNKGEEGEWIVEVDEKKEAKAQSEGGTVRSMGRRERLENERRNERKMRANERKGRKATD